MTTDTFAHSVKELGKESTALCPDPECLGLAEPEQDGDHKYFECTACGYAFGYERVQEEALVATADGSCSIGVPADIRRAASAPVEAAMAREEASKPVPLTLGKRPGL